MQRVMPFLATVSLLAQVPVLPTDLKKTTLQNPVARMELVGPSYSEKWVGGETRMLQWNRATLPSQATVTLEYHGKTEQNTFGTGGNPTWKPIASNLPNTGQYAWAIPGECLETKSVSGIFGSSYSLPADSHVLVRARTTVAGKELVDERRIPVLAPTIKLVSPKGGQTFKAGQVLKVVWFKRGPLASTVRLEVGQNTGMFVPFFSKSVPNTGSCDVLLDPARLPAGTSTVRIRMTSGVQGWIWDPATVDAALIEVIKP